MKVVTALTAVVGLQISIAGTAVAAQKQGVSSAVGKDGTIASIKNVPDYFSSNVHEYHIFYWSGGVKVEAYLTEPAKPGKYPLVVNLHGGYANPVPSIKGSTLAVYSADLVGQLGSTTAVELYPEYRGYEGSQGTVGGLVGGTQDAENAITMAQTLTSVRSDDTYLWGYSLGGGIALMLASDPGVKAVVAVSPYVGFQDFQQWISKHPEPDNHAWQHDEAIIQNVYKSYGKNTKSKEYSMLSPNIIKIKAPILLVQGTGDTTLVWQTVELFYTQLRAAHKTAKLALYPGAQHGVHIKSADIAIQNWFSRYGLELPV